MSLFMRVAVALAALAVWAGPSYAQCNGGPFAGPYVGATLGYGHYWAEQTSPGELTEASGSNDAFTAGGLIGYNVQCGRWITGLEADINYADFNADSSWPDQVYLNSSIDWFGTVRGRLGYTVRNDAQIYVTGGFAYADVTQRIAAFVPPAGSFFTQSDSEFKTGWTVGGGVEFLHAGRWTLRGEVLYVDLGDNSRTYSVVVSGCGGVCTGTARTDWDDSFVVARVGLSLKLGQEERYVPLK